ncbi:hypothetical protein PanWU01x14_307630 [Parasponia andersonii]|uniref:Uncharacterized protein n=1 Tax=Parasponia andersonii TaxID=3476 RepID=A0A2P5ARG5_PARAD|nr:hypothetical protein PanWU01x14_307630 [Parasponia andersonii]
MSDPYEKVKGNRLTFKGGGLATRSKPISKSKKKKKLKLDPQNEDGIEPKDVETSEDGNGSGGAAGEVYTIDAAKRMKYDELFPVEAKKFSYDPKSSVKTVEDALDDRVKKKADRYCK